ncbi:MAG: glycosyltransferase family 4 protein [Colwellia sp.]
MKENINVTVATGVVGKGGISTVLSTLKESGFFRATNTRLITSHKQGKFGKLSLALNFAVSIALLIRFFMWYKVGVVHIHMASRGSYSRKALIVRLAKSLGAKVIIHLHGAEFQVFYSDESSLKKQAHIRSTFNMADKVIVLSTQWQQWMNTIVSDSSKVCVVYNAVPEMELPKKTEKKEVVLFLGRLGKRKGVDDLIRAFSRISQQYPCAELHLGGDGDIAFYKKMAADLKLEGKVKLLGWVSGDEKNQHLANATIYCLPSYNEGFPMGVLEAMSSKVAVVSSKAGGIPDAITDKQEGILIDAGNEQALANALSILLESPQLRASYADSAFKKYVDNFSPTVINAQLESIYAELGS